MTMHTRTIAKSSVSRGIHSEIIAFLNTKFRSGMEIWANRISTCRFRKIELLNSHFGSVGHPNAMRRPSLRVS
jgi:hypothetical protein